jgi:hypothetical protein
VIDIVWKDQIEPMIQKRFPDVTAEKLVEAHAYAYGGCLIQDLGYYPFGSTFFTDLTHYVRSGDFVANLIAESSNVNEYAFALGALAHFTSDITAHPTVNHAVALSFPKLRKKYGDTVTYVQDPKAHLRVEFGFDMVQAAKNRYTSDQYHEFIGFEVSKPVLERAVLKTYGIHLEDALGPVDLAIGTFRRAVSLIIPQMTRVALAARRPEIVKDAHNFDEKKFQYHLSRSEYEREWGKDYRKPSFGAKLLALLLKFIPKVGPLKALAFKIPSTETEDLYIKSVNKTVENYTALLQQVERGQIQLSNLDLDTGLEPRAGEYRLTDETYARLLDELSKRGLDDARLDLRLNILAFYAHTRPLRETSKDRKAWCKTLDQLWMLRAVTPEARPHREEKK